MIFLLLILVYVAAFMWLKNHKKYYLLFCFVMLSVNPVIQKITDPTLYGSTWFDITIYRVVGDLLFIIFNIVWIISEKTYKAKSLRANKLDNLIYLWLLTNLLSVFASIDIYRSSVIFVVSVLGPTIFYIAVKNYLLKANDKRILYFTVPTAIFLHVFIGLLLFGAGIEKSGSVDYIQLRAVGNIWGGNGAVEILSLFFPFVFLRLNKNEVINLISKGGIFLCIIALQFTSFSRIGFLLILVMLLLAFIFKLMKAKWFFYLPVICLFILNIVILKIRPEFFEELHTRFFGNSNSILTAVENDSRFDLYHIALTNMESTPFLGIGISNFQLINPLGFSNAHNLFINILIERGGINFIMFLVVVFYLFHYNQRVIKLYADKRTKTLFRAIKIGLILLLINGMTGDDLFSASGFITGILSYFFYFIIAIHWIYLQRAVPTKKLIAPENN